MSSKLTFKKVRDTFPHWSASQCEAYLTGTQFADADIDVCAVIEESCMEILGELDDGDASTLAYCLYGYADACGPDVMAEPWFEQIADDWSIAYRWWE
jgi:hypothetical protein